IAVIEMKIGTTDGRPCDAYDSITWVENCWVAHVLNFKLGFSPPTKSFHNSSSSSIACKALSLHIGDWVFSKHDSLRRASNSTGADGLSCCRRNFTGFHQLLDVPKIFAYQLFGIEAREQRSRAREWSSGCFILQRDTQFRTAITRSFLEMNHPAVLDHPCVRRPGNEFAGLFISHFYLGR